MWLKWPFDLPMKKIGITGCIGSGKTIVSKVFSQLGVSVYNADEQAKLLMVEDPKLIEDIKALFGAEAYDSTGKLNRLFISTLVFQDKLMLEKLNELVHPVVFQDFEKWILQHQNEPYILKEAALIFESDSHTFLDQIIVVTASEELRISRTIQRDKTDRESVLVRMENQLTQQEKLSKADYEIVNDELSLVIPQVIALHKKLLAE